MKEKEFDYINVIPLVDVMLVLLAIVLTTSAFIAAGTIPVDLPKASKSHEAALKTLTIEIDKKGMVYLDSKRTSVPVLRTCLRPMNKSTPVLIRADRDIGLQIFVDVLDVVKTLEFRKVSLQTEQKA
ncbi:MAG: biopolymer transporter ExbD [Deltaproteobacteria bacterium]|nr:biopolymer transporter ExbD [Deltaproteobacteria bacterium]